MELTVEEQRILNGEQGEVLRQFMELLVSMGECYDAPRLIPVNSVHITSVSLATLREGGRQLIKKIADSGARVKAVTTCNPLATDCRQWRKLGIPEDEATKQFEVAENMCKIGSIACFTCTPYLIGHTPRFGEHIAWGEAGAVVYTNSALGARTNPEGGPSGFASALIGKTPLYGLHLDENRRAQVVVQVKTEIEQPAEYGAATLFAGRRYPEFTPVFVGMPGQTNWDGLKAMSHGLHLEGQIKLFHVAGVTPEASTEEQALGSKKPVDTVDFGKKELEDTIQSLNTDTAADVSWVVTGCPHCSITEIKNIAKLLDGRKVSSNVALWIHTSRPVKALADLIGFSEVIEKAGGKFVLETCPELMTPRTHKNLGYKSMATNSTVLAWSLPKLHGLKVHYGRVNQCIDAAVSGTWR